MGYIPSIIALLGFLLLWALYNSTQLKQRLEAIRSLQKSQEELENYISENKTELVDQRATLARNDLAREQMKLAKKLEAQTKAYNRSISKNPVRFLAKILGYKPIA